MKYIIHTDGGSRGNPGHAALGVVIEKTEGSMTSSVKSYGTYIGVATNNVAEYAAVLSALKTLTTMNAGGGGVYVFYLDSLLVVNQLNGIFKMKDSTLREYLSKIRIAEQDLGGTISYHHIPREQNADADREVNATLDTHLHQTL